jgi:hypothetical protein
MIAGMAAPTSPAAAHAVDAGKPTEVRVRQIIVFLAGALALELLVNRGELRFYWTPLILGLTYLTAAAVGGRDGGHWSGGIALTGWGLAVAWAGATRPVDVDIAGVYIAGVGAAFTVGALLAQRGWPVSTVSMGVTLVVAGLALALVTRVPELGDARTYVELLAVVVLGNVVVIARSAFVKGPAPARP